MGEISRRLTFLLLLATALAPSAGAQVVPDPSTPDSTPVGTVRAYFAAYNAHDVEGVIRLLAPEFVWLSVAGDSVVVEARGLTAVRSFLEGYYRQIPSAHSELEAVGMLGPWVSVRERARWESATGPRSQASMSVYEVRDGRLRRVWYFPEVR